MRSLRAPVGSHGQGRPSVCDAGRRRLSKRSDLEDMLKAEIRRAGSKPRPEEPVDEIEEMLRKAGIRLGNK